MPLSPEDSSFIAQLRLRSAPGSTNPPTLDEMKKAILILRGNRRLAQDASAASAAGKRSKSTAPTAAAIGDALADLDAM
jgi:hypothetical protein